MNPGKVENHGTIRPYAKSVSIIGVGCTPFMFTLESDETNGLTEGELYGYAALKAMEDAGIEPKDVDFYFHGEASPLNASKYITPNMQVANWFGMKGKGSIHHSEACCTGYLALDEAVNAVASGKYDVVLSGCVEFGDAIVEDPKKPQYNRMKFPMDAFLESTAWIYDNAYTRAMIAGPVIAFDDAAITYQRQYGLTEDQIDSAMIGMALANRKNASKHPLALMKVTYEDQAKQLGFDDVNAFMRSQFNPKMGHMLRVSGMEQKCDGAAAVIVASTEWARAHNVRHTPIEVLGIGSAACEGNTPHLEIRGTEEVVRQAYEMTGVKPEEIDLLFANDFIISSQLIAAESAGYLPRGEGWKYFVEGRTAYDGDKPINTNGGRTAFGHAHAASGVADIYEAVIQMRGLAGERQVKKLPKTTLLRGFGGGQNLAAILLRTDESMRKEDTLIDDAASPVRMETAVRKYYENLQQGKILGRKCKRCGHIEWPPFYACNTCGSADMEWVEMSGKGEMSTIILPAVLNAKPENMDLMPYAFSIVNMDGSEQNAIVQGVTKENAEELWAQMPIPVRAKIIERGAEGKTYPTVIFEIDTEELAKKKPGKQ